MDERKKHRAKVKRNSERFPADFMFQLTKAQKDEVAANCDHLQKHENKLQAHEKGIAVVVQAIKLLMPPPDDKPKEPFGFRRKGKH
jgi:hypothetical protein